MPLTAVRHIRKMRGGAQAHLLEADDGNWYVVKFRNNPQHRRILANELLAGTLLEYLKIAVPPSAPVHISSAFLAANPDVHFSLGTRRMEIEPGWHFGSRYPGDPARTAVYDFLPDALLAGVANLEDFHAVLVFDKWVANADGRQSVFHRALVHAPALRPRGRPPEPRPAFVALMIDHGFAFNGPHWDFPDAPLQGLYPRHRVYERVRSLQDFEPWLGLVTHFPEEVIDRAWKRIPPSWIEGDEDSFVTVLERLLERRNRVPDLVAACRAGRGNPFPNWR